MSDDILEESEFDYKDANIAFQKGEIAHPKIIPIILRPDVVFPFHVMHIEIHDANWKKVLDKVYEEKTVVGFMYRDEETEDLPVIGRVACSAVIENIDKTVSGSYLVKFVPINRFFTNEYVETEPVLTAEVTYYGDHPEDDAKITKLLKHLLPRLNKLGKITRGKTWTHLTLEKLRDDIGLHSFMLFRNNPLLTKHEELVALYLYEASLRLAWLIELVDKMLLSGGVERIAKTRFDAQNN